MRKKTMKTIEIVLKEIDQDSNKIVGEERIFFLNEHKIKKLRKDKGLLGELLRDGENGRV